MKYLINNVKEHSGWDFGNNVLYELCNQNPKHQDIGTVTAKVWLIGRAYAAAIERRKNKGEVENDDFYIDQVAPKIIDSNIDFWLSELDCFTEINEKSLPTILDVHYKVTNLFSQISGLEKRSLASKYLHFHYPHLFYIYDSRACNALTQLSYITGRVGRSKFSCADNEYRKLFEKCMLVKKYLISQYEEDFDPRQIDKLLLLSVSNA
ncbi:hypothetical protein [Aliivibrio fischeri]|uniref:hypothetical protein n=1 Tax=Aliivibrio fischeri TaxID=668 RepID=UPI000A52F90E|nr:hypothetical protein [Aliivibrio fischeri]